MNLQLFNRKVLFAEKCRSRLFLFLLIFSTVVSSAQNISNLLSQADQEYRQREYKKAFQIIDKAIALDTNCFMAYLGRATIYLAKENFNKAAIDYNMAIALATNGFEKYYAYSCRGYFYQQTTNPEAAINDFTKAIRINPACPDAYVQRAWVYNYVSNYNLAFIDCSTALLLDSKISLAHEIKGDVCRAKHDFDKAVESYTDAITSGTNAESAYFKRAIAYGEMEEYKRSIADFGKSIQLCPTNSFSYSNRGLLLSRIGDFKNGIKDCEIAVKLNPKSVMALNNLAWLLATAPDSKLRNGKRAVKNAQKACELSDWKDAYCLGTYAAALAEVGRFVEAIKWEERCIQLGLQKEKEMDQAKRELELFKQKKPYHADK